MLGFFITMAVLQTIFFFVRHGYMQLYYWTPYDYHIHHYNYGILTIIISYLLRQVLQGRISDYVISMLFGAGLFLVADEFGMLVKLREDTPEPLRYTGWIIVIISFLIYLVVRHVRQLILNKPGHTLIAKQRSQKPKN